MTERTEDLGFILLAMDDESMEVARRLLNDAGFHNGTHYWSSLSEGCELEKVPAELIVRGHGFPYRGMDKIKDFIQHNKPEDYAPK